MQRWAASAASSNEVVPEPFGKEEDGGCVHYSFGAYDRSKWLGNLIPDKSDGGECLVQSADMSEILGGQYGVLSSSYDESKSLQRYSSGF